MKKAVKMMIAAIVCGVVMTACGGGSVPKSNLPDNEYLGALPALYADEELAEDADKAKLKEAEAEGELAEIEEEVDKAAEERAKKLQADAAAEWAKIDGKEIPFKCTPEFEKLNLKVNSLKLSAGEQGAIVDIVAAQDISINTGNISQYDYVWYRVLAKDGTVIRTVGIFIATGMAALKGISFNKGQTITSSTGSNLVAQLHLANDTEKWANFAGIEFIVKSERKVRNQSGSNQ
jgi:hypothetical protein